MILEHKTLSYKGKVIFDKMILEHFQRVPKPVSETEACFMYLQEGSFHFRTPNKVIHIKEGDAMLAKCSDYFFEQTQSDHEYCNRTKGIGAYLYPSIVKELFDFDLSVSDFVTDYDATKVETDGLMKNFVDGIDFLLDNPSISSDSLLKIKLKEFLLLLAKTENAPSLADFIASLFKPYEYDFKNVVNQNIFADLSISELARLCGMSASTFQRSFFDIFQQTPSRYILQQRMAKAKNLLSNKSNRISDVAYDCGYKSVSTFNRLFKNSFGTTPTEFRMNEIGQ